MSWTDRGDNCWHGDKATNVNITYATIDWLSTRGVVGEKVPVVLFHIGVIVLFRSKHKADIMIEPAGGVVVPGSTNQFK